MSPSLLHLLVFFLDAFMTVSSSWMSSSSSLLCSSSLSCSSSASSLHVLHRCFLIHHFGGCLEWDVRGLPGMGLTQVGKVSTKSHWTIACAPFLKWNKFVGTFNFGRLFGIFKHFQHSLGPYYEGLSAFVSSTRQIGLHRQEAPEDSHQMVILMLLCFKDSNPVWQRVKLSMCHSSAADPPSVVARGKHPWGDRLRTMYHHGTAMFFH